MALIGGTGAQGQDRSEAGTVTERSHPQLEMAYGTWDEAESWLGRQLPFAVGADRADESVVRRRLESLEWACGRSSAEETPSRIPLSMLFTLALPAYWNPGDPQSGLSSPAKLPPIPILRVPAPGTQVTVTECILEAAEPIRFGDRVTASSRMTAFTRKRLRIGDGAFMTQETTYTADGGRQLGKSTLTLFRFTPEEKA